MVSVRLLISLSTYFLNETATTEIYTRGRTQPLHDARPSHPAPAGGRRLGNVHSLIGPRIERGLDAPGNKAVYLGEQRLTFYVRLRPLGGGIGVKDVGGNERGLDNTPDRKTVG